MKSSLFVIFALLLSQNSYALGLNTGSDLLNACEITEGFLKGTSNDSKKAESCFHFLMGFDSGQSVASLTHNQNKLYCQPKGSTISNMISSVVNNLKKDKTYHDAPAGIAAWKALSSTWPCK